MRSLILLSLILGVAACGDDDLTFPDAGTPDAGPVDATVDVQPQDGGMDAARERFCLPPDIRWQTSELAMTPGVTREIRLDLERDFCEGIDLSFRVADTAVATTVESAVFEPRRTRVVIPITGVAVGEVEVTASYVDRIDGVERTAVVTVRVEEPTRAACSGDGGGRLTYGAEVVVEDGTLAGSALMLPEGAARDDQYHVDEMDVAIDCGAEQIPEGFAALGPAVRFAPEPARLSREIFFTVPIRQALIPQGRSVGDVQMAYTGPGVLEARIVPVASPDFSEDGFVTFEAPRFGTYQAVVREGARGTREREFSFRGIMGVSMGSAGAATVGTNNTDRFDFIGPLGGPVDWIHMLHYLREYHVGGFCDEAQRLATPEACATAQTSRTPAPGFLEVAQDFEHWNYDDEYMGQGGTFDRREYVQIFRDLSIMYGNMNSTRALGDDEPNVTPPGIPDSRRRMSNADRCANPVILAAEPAGGDADPMTGFYDDEYNPEGQYPVITFCDGGELIVDGDRDIGFWEPGPRNNYPVEVVLAVDINANGTRDPGEPVIRQGRESFEDCGLDQVCSVDEEGYDAINNPDPAGDDYDYQYNPNGTEGNWIRDYTGAAVAGCASPTSNPAVGTGEVFTDAGLDGVFGTPQLDVGGYDTGEGDECWTVARGMQQMLDTNPRGFVQSRPLDELKRVDFFSDGGVRDLFSFGSNQNQLAGAFAGRGLPVGLFNSHAGLLFNGLRGDADFVYTQVDWSQVGQYVHIRYGDIDADEGTKEIGDGGHVGTVRQILNRLLGTMAWMSDRWPGGDREQDNDTLCVEVSALCPNINQLEFEFEASDGRTGPTSVVLPPGYFYPENADKTYPVVYLLHGYGMNPSDLLATGIIIWNLMTSRVIPHADRLQKMIFVFPDGSCSGDECLSGTFYTNGPAANGGAQMETFTLELMDYIDATYRTRDPEIFTVPD